MAKRSKELSYFLRADGRPEVCDVLADAPDGSDGYSCAWCAAEGQLWRKYKKIGEIYMSQAMAAEGTPLMVCNAHLPENAVIVNLPDRTCRNKQGNIVWSADSLQ